MQNSLLILLYLLDGIKLHETKSIKIWRGRLFINIIFFGGRKGGGGRVGI